jgi:TRAP-type mannitol/chloroaromatic compound transport system substrate-binding protein
LAGNAIALDTLINKHGVDARHFPEPVIDAMIANSDDVVAAAGAHDDISKRIYESWTAFRARMVQLAPYGEYGYMNARARHYA